MYLHELAKITKIATPFSRVRLFIHFRTLTQEFSLHLIYYSPFEPIFRHKDVILLLTTPSLISNRALLKRPPKQKRNNVA